MPEPWVAGGATSGLGVHDALDALGLLAGLLDGLLAVPLPSLLDGILSVMLFGKGASGGHPSIHCREENSFCSALLHGNDRDRRFLS
jgi:hypothetical protein